VLLLFRYMAGAGVVVGRVVEIRPHPRRDLIWLATVDTGTGCKPQIVWGGIPIVRAGHLVPVAQPGTWLQPTKDKPNPYKIRRRRYAGEISEGMLCSLAELGWDPSVADWVALLDTSADLQAGQPLGDRSNDWRAIVLQIDVFEAKRLAGLLVK
jgi:phenylalanyl-tRNA synthetase beta chain